MRRIFFFFLPCLFLMLSARVHAGGFADSPWPMCGRDPGHSSCSVTGLPTTNVLKWKFQGDGNLGSPVIGVDGTLYFGSNDGNPYDSTNCGYLYAVNPDGSLRWKSFSGRSTYSSIPAIGEDGTIYIGSQDSCLYAFNPDGTLKWKYLTSGAIDSSPVIGYSGYIYINSYDCNLYALNSNGDLQWKFMYYSINDCPAVGKDGTVYMSRNRNCLYALNPDGSIKWQYGPITYTFESPSICDDESTIYVGASNKLFAI